MIFLRIKFVALNSGFEIIVSLKPLAFYGEEEKFKIIVYAYVSLQMFTHQCLQGIH